MSSADSVPVGAFLAQQGLVNIGQFTGLALGSGLNGAAQGQNLSLVVDPPGGYLGNVATIAALTASDDTAVANQSVRRVDTVLQNYWLDKASTATVDGITVVPTLSGVGRWLRSPSPVPKWTAQLNWDVDPIGGNDENSGLAGASLPLKTLAEVCRRLRRVNYTAYTVNVLNNDPLVAATVPNTDVVRFEPEFGSDTPLGGTTGATLLIKGTVVAAVSSAFTATAATVPATNTQASVTDASVTWAAQLGNIITMTSGAALGAVAVVLKDLGAGAARVSEWVFPLTGVLAANPSPADTYTIGSYPTLAAGLLYPGQRSRANVNFQRLKINPTAGYNPAFCVPFFFECMFVANTGIVPVPYNAQYLGCSILVPGGFNIFASVITPLGSSFTGCGILNTIIQGANSGELFFTNTVIQGGRLQGNDVAFQRQYGLSILLSGKLGMFDSPAATPAINLRRGMNMSITGTGGAGATGLYGSGNATYGIEVQEGAALFVSATATPTITGVTADLRLAGAATAYQALELSTGALAAAAVVPLTTWAQYVAAVVLNVSGFDRNVMSYKDGSRISSTT